MPNEKKYFKMDPIMSAGIRAAGNPVAAKMIVDTNKLTGGAKKLVEGVARKAMKMDDVRNPGGYLTPEAVMKLNGNGKDSKSGSPYPDGDPTKVDWSKTPKFQRDEVALDLASKSGTVYRRYNVPGDLAKDLKKPNLSGMRVTEEILAANINNAPSSIRNKWKNWFSNAQREKFEYFKANYPDAFKQMLSGTKYKIK